MFACREDRPSEAVPTLEKLEPRVLLDAVRSPWLAGVTDTSVYACLEATNNTQDVVVDYGLDTLYGMQATTETAQATASGYYVHNAKLIGLAPDTLYHYRVKHGAYTSPDYTFYTAPLAGAGAHWGFAADCRTDTSWHNTMAGLIDSHDPRMMVYGGDLCATGTWSSWNQEWFMYPASPSYTNQVDLNATTPFVNAAGNHEGWNSLTAAFTQSPEGDGESGNGYFSFDYGDAHIVVINSLFPYYKGSDQWNFVADDLAATDKAWKIVTSHYCTYASGSHGSDGTMQQMCTELFEPNGVQLTLAGHNHFYQHNEVNDITHMVIGTFGVTPSSPTSASWTIHSEATRCFGIIDTTPTTLTLTTYRQNGTVIETIELTIDATPPTTPAGLSATALDEHRVELGWIASTDLESGVDHYNIYRDGGLVGTASGTSYTDTGLDEQTTYTYRVSAVNGDRQESPQSDPDSATTPTDTTAPTITSAAWAADDQVNVLFSEPVEQTSAENVNNYVIYSSDQYVHVLAATLQADNRTVALGVSTMSEAKTYTLEVSNVSDRALAPNTIAPGSQATFAFQGWTSQDIGNVDVAGITTYSAGTYTIQADGADIFDNSDHFRYVYTTLDGDGEIVARVTTIPNVWVAKGGVMMRASLESSSQEVSMVLGGRVKEAYFQRRTSFGGSTGHTGIGGIVTPYYVRVVRSGGVFSGYLSSTGQAGTWAQVGPGVSVSAMAGGTIYVGLAACNQTEPALSTFVMDNVQLIEYGAPANVAPVGVADGYVAAKNSALNVAPGGGVLVNDTDANSDSLSAAPAGGVSNGSLTLYANGSFDYTPAAEFVGTDSFTYRAGDGELSSGDTTVTIRVAISGDANLDDLVDGQDFTLLKANYGEGTPESPTTWTMGNFNDDWVVDGQDFTIMKAYYGQSASPAGGYTDSLSAFAAEAFAARQVADARQSGLPERAQAAPGTLASRRLGLIGVGPVGIPAPAAASAADAAPDASASPRPLPIGPPAPAPERIETLELGLEQVLVDVLESVKPIA